MNQIIFLLEFILLFVLRFVGFYCSLTLYPDFLSAILYPNFYIHSIDSGGLPSVLVIFICIRFNIGNRGTLNVAQSSNCKTPILNDNVDYEKWQKEIKIWVMFTSLEKKKHAIFLTITGQAHEAMWELDLNPALPVDSHSLDSPFP